MFTGAAGAMAIWASGIAAAQPVMDNNKLAAASLGTKCDRDSIGWFFHEGHQASLLPP